MIWEARGENSQACTSQHHSTHTPDQDRKRHILHLPQEMILLYYLGWRKKRFLLAQYQRSLWETAITQPMKSHYTLNFLFPPMDSSFTRAPPQFIKEHFPLSLLQACSDLPHVLNCSSLLLLNKPILLEKYLTVY